MDLQNNTNKLIDEESNDCIFENINKINNFELTTSLSKLEEHAILLAELKTINGKKLACNCNKNKYMVNSSFSIFKSYPPKSFFNYGIDLSHYFSVINNYILLVAIFYILIFAVVLIGLIRSDFEFPKINNEGFNFLYFELYIQLILVSEGEANFKKPSSRLILNFTYLIVRVIIINVIIKMLLRRMKKTREEYIEYISDVYIDDGIYSIFVKNLPKLTNANDLKTHFESNFPVKIKRIILMKKTRAYIHHLNKIGYLEEKLQASNNLNLDILNNRLQKYKDRNSEIENSNDFSKTAIIQFEKIEDKLYFWSNAFLNKCCRKVHKFQGRQFFVENVPQLNLISWGNIGNSYNKVYTKYFSIGTWILWPCLVLVSCILIVVQQLPELLDEYYVSSLVLFLINSLLEYIIEQLILLLRTNNKYINVCLLRSYIMNKTFLGAIFIKIITWRYITETDDWTLLYTKNKHFLIFIVMINIKFFVSMKYPMYKILNNISFYYRKCFNKPSLNNIDYINSAYEKPELDIMRQHEYFRTLVITTIFLIKFFPILSLVQFLIIVIYKYYLKWIIFNHSSIKKIVYYGHYFDMFLHLEVRYLGITNVILMGINVGREYSDVLKIGNVLGFFQFFIMDLFYVLHFYSKLNPLIIYDKHPIENEKSNLGKGIKLSFDDIGIINKLEMRTDMNDEKKHEIKLDNSNDTSKSNIESQDSIKASTSKYNN